MINSMTAFHRGSQQTECGTLVWEIRSINSRYLEKSFRLPDAFRHLEGQLTERMRNHITRGKIECSLKFDHHQDSQGMQIDLGLAKQLIGHAQQLAELTDQPLTLNPLELMKWPGLMVKEKPDEQVLTTAIVDSFEQAIQSLTTVRGREGDTMKGLLLSRLAGIRTQVDQVRQHMPEVIEWQRERLNQRIANAQIEVDASRLEQEILMLMQKSDVAEELDRLDSHIKETTHILTKGGACGRRLDFMMQEFNREANTLGSKSISQEVTAASVELKVLIEQMREQIQNIE